MHYEERNSNDQLWALAGIADIVFDECCLKSETMRIDDAGGQTRMDLITGAGITVTFSFDKDSKWTGHCCVTYKSRKTGQVFEVNVEPLDKLTDYLMKAKDFLTGKLK